MTKGAIGRRALVALGVAAVALSALSIAPSAAAQNTPPGWQDPGVAGEWVAFTLDDYDPAPAGRTSYAPVTLQRSASGGFDLAWFDNWDVIDADGTPGPEQWRWPLVWEGGGVRLLRSESCDWTETECDYTVDPSSNGSEFWFFAGDPPLDPSTNQPVPDPTSFAGNHIGLAALPTIQIAAFQAVGIAGTGGSAGKIHLDAPGTHDEQAGTTLTYQWVLVHVDTGTTYDSGPTSADFYEPTVQHDGNYCVQVTVTASDGHIIPSATCSSGTGAVFSINGVAPAPPGSGGGGGGGGVTPPPAGGGGSGGGGGLPGIGFSNPASRAPSVLTGGGGASPTVVWLWRPEWYQPEPETSEQPRTSGQPALTERRDIIISGGSPNGSSAGPWLAGVGIVGLFGGGWLVSRRRRMRMLAEL